MICLGDNMNKTKKFFIANLFLILMVSSCGGNQKPTSSISSSENLNSMFVSSGTSIDSSLESSSSDKELNMDKINEIINGSFIFEITSQKTESNVELHSKAQLDYINGSYLDIANYADGKEEKSHPAPVTFDWTTNALNDNVVSYYTLSISENSDMSNPYTVTSEETSIDVYNLKIGTKYYWNVSTLIGNLSFVSETYDFVTNDNAPRNLYIDGITNARDLGGWKTLDGKRVKQGLIYRTGRLNKNYTNLVLRDITAKGRKTMMEQLKIKSEIDLRRTDNNEIGGLKGSPLSESVNYYCTPMIYEADNQTISKNFQMIKNVFSILANESNYPLFYHCSIGTDRTGLISFLVNGLLGVSEEDLYKDYLFSNFGDIGSNRELNDIMDDYVNLLKSKEGNSLSEKIENFLLEIGVTSQEISQIKTILIEN